MGKGLPTLLFLSNVKRKRMKRPLFAWVLISRVLLAVLWGGCRAPLCPQPHAIHVLGALPLEAGSAALRPLVRLRQPVQGDAFCGVSSRGGQAAGNVYSARVAGIRTSALLVCPHFLGLKPKQTVSKKPTLETGVCAGHEEWCPGEKHLCSWLSAKKRQWCFWPTVLLWDTS